jgi:hypothetical protein
MLNVFHLERKVFTCLSESSLNCCLILHWKQWMQKYLERAAGLEATSPDCTVFRAVEGIEPSFLPHTSYGTLERQL